jgi:hypothetical protein
VKYALIGSAIPFAVLFGRAVVRHRRAAAPKPAPEAQRVAQDPSLDRLIRLPHGGAFAVRQLVDYIEQSGRDYIIRGEVDCALADHPMPSSLDYWLRENFARNKETREATAEVIEQLVQTGLFEEAAALRCPDTREPSPGLRLRS